MNRSRWQSIFWSVLLHLGIMAVGMFSVSFSSPAAMPQQLAIKATVVDMSVLESIAEAQLEDERALQREAEAAARAEQARERREQQEREAKERAEAEQLEAEKQARLRAEEEARLEQERLTEQARQAEADAAKKAKEAAERKERERQAELKRKREAEEKRQAEAAARKRREEEARRQQEAEALLLAQLEEEEQRLSAANAGLRDQYVALIRQKIQRNWLRPAGAKAGLKCEVAVTQLPSREVVDVRVGQCNGDAATVRSIEAAVYKASPLPSPPDPTLFERKLLLIFEPDA